MTIADLAALKGAHVPKRYIAGTHRTRSPRETLAAYTPFMRQLGITRLANITHLDHLGMPVWTGIRPNARTLATSQGKGEDHDSAKASALMEAIEFHHAEHLEGLPLRYDTYRGLKRIADVCPVELLPRHPATRVAAGAPRLWIEGYDVARGVPAWVPFSKVCISNAAEPFDAEMLVRSSNGLASGNHRLEAIVHGLCEVIERHGGARDDPARRVYVDLAKVTFPPLRSVLDRLEGADVAVAAWEIPCSIAVPSYGAMLVERPTRARWRLVGTYGGAGAHLSPSVAMMRALTEAVQSRVTFIAGSRDDMTRAHYWATQDETAQQVFFDRVEAAKGALVPMVEHARETDSFEGDLATLLECLRAEGHKSVIVVDLTRPELEIPVVTVIVPGLEEGDH
ncbi:MAG TPA: YcaO-like family protein [Polyangiaceae bacterium]